MTEHTLTPAEIASIRATVDRVHRERADAPTMAAKYDAACERIAELLDEMTQQRHRVRELEEENTRLKDDLEDATRFQIGNTEIFPNITGTWTLCVDRDRVEKADTRDAALARARKLKEET